MESDADVSWFDGITFAVWRTTNAVTRVMDAGLRDFPVTGTQLGAAVSLDEMGPMSAAELARRFHISPQGLLSAFARLEQGGWVRRAPHPTHGRIVLYELTDSGRELVAEGRRRMRHINEQISVGLTEQQRRDLIAALRTVTLTIGGSDEVATAWPLRDDGARGG